MSIWRDALGSDIDQVLGRPLSPREGDLLEGYLDLLVRWQRIHRLVGSSDPRWIVRNIVLDSLLFRKVLPQGTTDLLDIGSGAGVPGLILKLVEPGIRLVMVESRRHRASFLSAALRELRMVDASVVNQRIEEVARELAGRFDAAVSRCAGDLRGFFDVALDLVKPGGSVIASGPPKPHPLVLGQWTTVSGVGGRSRLFAVARRPAR